MRARQRFDRLVKPGFTVEATDNLDKFELLTLLSPTHQSFPPA